MTENIRDQLQAFIRGFKTILPTGWVAHLSPSELELMISGLSKIDVADMKESCVYKGYSTKDSQIVWFWEILEEFTDEQRVELLYFTTGKKDGMPIKFYS